MRRQATARTAFAAWSRTVVVTFVDPRRASASEMFGYRKRGARSNIAAADKPKGASYLL
jgi:hypothetical protein